MKLEHLDDTNRRIVSQAMADNDKHLWCLVRWVQREMKRKGRRCQWQTGPAAIQDLLGEGHTVACVIWDRYINRPMPSEIGSHG